MSLCVFPIYLYYFLPDCQYVWTAGYTENVGSSAISDWYWHLGYTIQQMSDVQEDGQMFWGGNEPNNLSGDQKALMLGHHISWAWSDMPDDPSSYSKNFCAICELNQLC